MVGIMKESARKRSRIGQEIDQEGDVLAQLERLLHDLHEKSESRMRQWLPLWPKELMKKKNYLEGRIELCEQILFEIKLWQKVLANQIASTQERSRPAADGLLKYEDTVVHGKEEHAIGLKSQG
jgi:hypothetical protein